MSKDLNLLYSGGSGGFVLLYFLLLSDQYEILFRNKNSFQQAFDQQWKISNPDQWKNVESWPNNAATYQLATSKNKIYYHCNPNFKHPLDLVKYCQYNLALYTDYTSQLTLAYYKKAWIYDKVPRPSRDPKFTAIREFVRTWKSHYKNIKDPSWPECSSIKKFNNLPDKVKKELLQNPYTQRFLDYRYLEPTAIFNGQYVFDQYVPYLETADLTVRLQDFINSRGQNVVDLLNLPTINNQQLALIDHWCNLHPVELLTQVGINV